VGLYKQYTPIEKNELPVVNDQEQTTRLYSQQTCLRAGVKATRAEYFNQVMQKINADNWKIAMNTYVVHC
jgi:hypothetical protein